MPTDVQAERIAFKTFTVLQEKGLPDAEWGWGYSRTPKNHKPILMLTAPQPNHEYAKNLAKLALISAGEVTGMTADGHMTFEVPGGSEPELITDATATNLETGETGPGLDVVSCSAVCGECLIIFNIMVDAAAFEGEDEDDDTSTCDACHQVIDGEPFLDARIPPPEVLADLTDDEHDAPTGIMAAVACDSICMARLDDSGWRRPTADEMASFKARHRDD